MRLAIDSQHLYYFNTQHYVSFEELVSKQEMTRLVQEITLTINERLSVKLAQKNQDIFPLRDLWRENEYLQRFVRKKSLLHVLSQLTEERKISLGYDLVLGKRQSLFPNEKFTDFSLPSYPGKQTLQQVSSCQEVLGGILVFCGNKEDGIKVALSENEEEIKPGQFVFLHKECEIDFVSLMNQESVYLLVFGKPPLVYIHNAQDPYHYSWRDLGYEFGDRLKDKTHPQILF
jgi:hypothetical protein